MIFVKLNADGMLQSDERKMESHLLANILDHGHLVTQDLQVSSQILGRFPHSHLKFLFNAQKPWLTS